MKAKTKEAVLRELILQSTQTICTPDDIIRALNKSGTHAKHTEIVRVLAQLVDEGYLMRARSNRYGKPEAFGCAAGTFCATGRGYAFVRPENGEGPDIFIPPHKDLHAWHGDRVLIRIRQEQPPRRRGKQTKSATKSRQEGEVLRILNETRDEITGRIVMRGKMTVFHDDSGKLPEIVVSKKHLMDAHPGDRVALKVLFRGNEKYLPQGTVMKIFGSGLTVQSSADAILYEHGITVPFPQAVLDETNSLPMFVREEDWKGRLDLRSKMLFTIDGDSAKDFDDAVSLETLPNGHYRLGVHIADVSYYVKPGSPLDQEAYNRGTSVYYADQVVPMLPKALSNGICSLNENELRLAFSCLMRLDKEGNLTDYRFVKSIIRSRVKGVYSEINALLAGTADAEIKAKYADVIDQLPAMKELYGHRARLRKERGCMDIESGEVKLILDEDGHCIDVKKRTSGESESMIEEFMLLANQCAAHFARVKQIPFVYRVHEEPNAEKLERLHALLQACGINDHFAKEVPTPKELSAILEGVRGTPFEQIVNTGMLRCMSKAVYEEKPKGHYGLVLKDYAHFTSPIRRYPDLAIHRIMTDLLRGTDKETMILRYSDFAEKASKQSSEREIIAMQIERKAEDCYKAEYARRHLGECYEGTISGVTQRGLFVELENGVEGFVPASSLTPSGTNLTEGIRLSDPVSGKSWSLGDSMMITIVRADVNLGKVDFEVAPEKK